MVDPKAVAHGRIEVLDVHWFFRHVVTEVIRFSVDDAWANSATSHPLCKATRMMVSTVIGFR